MTLSFREFFDNTQTVSASSILNIDYELDEIFDDFDNKLFVSEELNESIKNLIKEIKRLYKIINPPEFKCDWDTSINCFTVPGTSLPHGKHICFLPPTIETSFDSFAGGKLSLTSNTYYIYNPDGLDRFNISEFGYSDLLLDNKKIIAKIPDYFYVFIGDITKQILDTNVEDAYNPGVSYVLDVSGKTITLQNHGFAEEQAVRIIPNFVYPFFNKLGLTGALKYIGLLDFYTDYYIKNATANTFELSTTPGDFSFTITRDATESLSSNFRLKSSIVLDPSDLLTCYHIFTGTDTRIVGANFKIGDTVKFVSKNQLPPPLETHKEYVVVDVLDNDFYVFNNPTSGCFDPTITSNIANYHSTIDPEAFAKRYITDEEKIEFSTTYESDLLLLIEKIKKLGKRLTEIKEESVSKG